MCAEPGDCKHLESAILKRRSAGWRRVRGLVFDSSWLRQRRHAFFSDLSGLWQREFLSLEELMHPESDLASSDAATVQQVCVCGGWCKDRFLLRFR